MRHNRINPAFHRRLWVLAAFFALGLGALTWRLGQVQLTHGTSYDEDASRQCLRRILLEPVRGRILAANGEALVDSRACYDLIFHPNEMRRPRIRGKNARTSTMDYILETAYDLANRLHRPIPITRLQLEKQLNLSPAMAITIFRDLNPRETAILTEIAPPIPGMEIVPRIIRTYPRPGLASHILGFTAKQQRDPPGLDEEGGEEEESGPRFAYLPPALVGRQGLERACDEELSGKTGEKTVQVDILGYIHSEIGNTIPPQPGGDLLLTIDLRAQRAAERALRGKVGALVALNANTGAVLAMASSPSYDLSRLTTNTYRRLAADTVHKPLINRAVSASYQPGSILKPLAALAALQCNAINPAATIICTGSYHVGNKAVGCWKRDGHGTVSLVPALSQSCNCYFIRAGLNTGFDNFLPVLQAAGLGRETGLELGGARGFLPSREWAEREREIPWASIDTAYLSIGQGPITITPVQAAMYTAAIANGGSLFRPYLVQAIRTPGGALLRQTAPASDHHLPAMQSELALIHQGMWDAVNGTDATAATARNSCITLAGKTGTAEVGTGANRHKNTWFIAYAPADNPKYAIAIVVERGQSGGHTAAPLAKQFFEGWLGSGTLADSTPAVEPGAATDPDLNAADAPVEPDMATEEKPTAPTADTAAEAVE